MFQSVRRIAITAAFLVPGLIGVSIAQASAAGPNAIVTSGHIGPNSNLKIKAGDLKFSPSVLEVPVKPGKCKANSYQFSITNTTSKSQAITLNGARWETLSPGQLEPVCTGEGTSSFAVTGTGAMLTVNSTGGA
jgi:hypothetical protein